jgi:hypothetical protein
MNDSVRCCPRIFLAGIIAAFVKFSQHVRKRNLEKASWYKKWKILCISDHKNIAKQTEESGCNDKLRGRSQQGDPHIQSILEMSNRIYMQQFCVALKQLEWGVIEERRRDSKTKCTFLPPTAGVKSFESMSGVQKYYKNHIGKTEYKRSH